MINRKRKTKKRLPIILLITTVLISLMYFGLNNKHLNEIKILFHNLGSSINKALVIDYYKVDKNITLGINSELEKENIELKKLLGEKDSNYKMITAKVIKRDIEWFKQLTIDKGKKDNIEINMAVINNNGLIGKIIEVGDNYSIVQLITSNLSNSKVAVDVKGLEDYHGILSSYDKEYGLIVIDNIMKNSEIRINDSVYTNGLGGIIPSGIYIGKVVDITYDDLGLNKIVKVKPDISFDSIRYVNVIGR